MDFANSEEGGRALLYAVEKGDIALVRALLLLGVDVNFISDDYDSTPPLITAAACGHAHIVHLLIAAGADVNARASRLRTALMVASDTGIIKTLLDSGVDVSASDIRGMTPLMHQARRGNLEGVEALLVRGADPNTRDNYGDPALVHAMAGGYVHVEQSLLQVGADPDVRDLGPLIF
jgi:uncharacterized protein